MSDDSEFYRSDAATGKERRPTVVNRNSGTNKNLKRARDHDHSHLRNSFYRATLRCSTVYAVIVYLFVCHMPAKLMITRTRPHDSPGTL